VTSLDDLADLIRARAEGADRFVVAIAGPPGAGKSTLSQALAARLPPTETAVLQADGFHFDNDLLVRLGRRDRKGAPDTFDVAGLDGLLGRIRAREAAVVAPVFDRTLDVARAGALVIGTEIRLVLVEGNYLLLTRGPWAALRPRFDLTLRIDVPRAELERRLLARWHDLGWSPEAARAWVDGNDLPNVDTVLAESGPADLVWSPGAAI
jgi:pantothenate kinase